MIAFLQIRWKILVQKIRQAARIDDILPTFFLQVSEKGAIAPFSIVELKTIITDQNGASYGSTSAFVNWSQSRKLVYTVRCPSVGSQSYGSGCGLSGGR